MEIAWLFIGYFPLLIKIVINICTVLNVCALLFTGIKQITQLAQKTEKILFFFYVSWHLLYKHTTYLKLFLFLFLFLFPMLVVNLYRLGWQSDNHFQAKPQM